MSSAPSPSRARSPASRRSAPRPASALLAAYGASRRPGHRVLALALGLAAIAVLFPCTARADFTTFESGPVRPLALSPDGTRLFAANTPDDQLEIYAVASGGLTHLGSVSVGLEPVAVAARTSGEVRVVNHLSDSISIVDVAASPPRVTRTLLEPERAPCQPTSSSTSRSET